MGDLHFVGVFGQVGGNLRESAVRAIHSVAFALTHSRANSRVETDGVGVVVLDRDGRPAGGGIVPLAAARHVQHEQHEDPEEEERAHLVREKHAAPPQ